MVVIGYDLMGQIRMVGAAAGPAAQPPTRAKPVCFDAVETACGRKAAVCRNLRGEFYIRLQFVRLAAGAFKVNVCSRLRRGKPYKRLN